jgi:hypothetical protein
MTTDRPRCNCAWPCDELAFWAVKVFDTMPRYACYLHEREMRRKNADLRRLDTFPGPWVAPSLQKEGEIILKYTCPVETCKGRVCNGGQKETNPNITITTKDAAEDFKQILRPRIPHQDFMRFNMDFFDGKFPHQRYGQAFYNHFARTDSHQPHPELFYEEDTNKAKEIIFTQYIILG